MLLLLLMLLIWSTHSMSSLLVHLVGWHWCRRNITWPIFILWGAHLLFHWSESISQSFLVGNSSGQKLEVQLCVWPKPNGSHVNNVICNRHEPCWRPWSGLIRDLSRVYPASYLLSARIGLSPPVTLNGIADKIVDGYMETFEAETFNKCFFFCEYGPTKRKKSLTLSRDPFGSFEELGLSFEQNGLKVLQL